LFEALKNPGWHDCRLKQLGKRESFSKLIAEKDDAS
jgi:hypothetical protein